MKQSLTLLTWIVLSQTQVLGQIDPDSQAVQDANARRALMNAALEKDKDGNIVNPQTALPEASMPDADPIPSGAPDATEDAAATPESSGEASDSTSTSLNDLLSQAGGPVERPDLKNFGELNPIEPALGLDVETVTLNAPFMPFEQLLQEYSRITGRFLLRTAVIDSAPEEVYVVFDELTPREALDYLNATLALNKIAILPVGKRFLRVVSSADAPKAGQPFNPIPTDEIPETGQFMRKVVQLDHALASEISEILFQFASPDAGDGAVTAIDSNNVLILQDYGPNVKRMMEMIEKIDVQIPINIEMKLFPIRFALAEEIAQILGSLTPSGAVSVGGGNARNSLRSRSTSGGLGGSRGGNNNRNSFGSNSGATNTTANRSQFQQNIQSIVNRAAAGEFQILGETRIIPDVRTNAILVFAQKRDLAMIEKIIAEIDIVQSQVLIEAVIMEVSLSEDEEFGVSYISRPQTEGGVTGVGGIVNNPGVSDIFLNPRNFASGDGEIEGLPGGLSYFSQLGTDLNVAVSAIQRNSNGTILQKPRIQTFHAKEARIFVGERQPFVGSSFFGVSTASSTQVDFLDVGVELLILPLINQEGLVVMEIVQNIAGVTEFRTIGDNEVPVTNEKQTEASVAVRSGETVMLGGFIERRRTTSDSGVPVLKNIPYLGRLFKSTTTREDKSELVVLIKPTVLPTPEYAVEVAEDELNQLMGIRSSQVEFEMLDEKYRRALDAKIQELERKRARNARRAGEVETIGTK